MQAIIGALLRELLKKLDADMVKDLIDTLLDKLEDKISNDGKDNFLDATVPALIETIRRIASIDDTKYGTGKVEE
jgi:hypothetical protein